MGASGASKLDKAAPLAYTLLSTVQQPEALQLANTKSAIKAVRQSERKRVRNRVVVSSTRTYVKKVRAAIESGDVEQSREALLRAISALDKAAQKGIMHKNTAARSKSRLTRRLNALAAE
jgi:small subunit ribosomal protein S20